MAAAEALLAHVAAWHKQGLQKLTSAVDKHKAALSLLIDQADAEIRDLVAFCNTKKPRKKGRAAAKQQAVRGASSGAGARVCCVFGSKRRNCSCIISLCRQAFVFQKHTDQTLHTLRHNLFNRRCTWRRRAKVGLPYCSSCRMCLPSTTALRWAALPRAKE
jgi:hypothetical protein